MNKGKCAVSKGYDINAIAFNFRNGVTSAARLSFCQVCKWQWSLVTGSVVVCWMISTFNNNNNNKTIQTLSMTTANHYKHNELESPTEPTIRIHFIAFYLAAQVTLLFQIMIYPFTALLYFTRDISSNKMISTYYY